MDAKQDIDTDYTDEPVCPWCGETVSDAWELFPGVEEREPGYECNSCKREFDITRNVSISYSTDKVPE